MKRFIILVLIIFTVLAFSGCKKKAVEGTVIARVNRTVFTLEELEEQIPPYLSVPIDKKQAFVDEWINTELVYEEAIKKGINKDGKVEKKLELLLKQFLANELLSRRLEGEGDVSDFEVKEYFQEHERDFNSQIKIAHILLSTENEARKILEKLKAREDFITIARTFSQDTITATNGGLLPRYFKFGEMFDTPEFEEAAFSIKKIGGYSDIAKTAYGYHIIKLIDRKPTKEKITLEDVGMQIQQYLITNKQKKVMDTWLDSLKTTADIETNYDLIK
ncbi:peptidylprolyl isomerase [candidate division WOR-3 bacterium]|nr:peptidylprolyl isomerase [candidate division WOR-3 bacterium]